jgi:hypothetical protein
MSGDLNGRHDQYNWRYLSKTIKHRQYLIKRLMNNRREMPIKIKQRVNMNFKVRILIRLQSMSQTASL